MNETFPITQAQPSDRKLLIGFWQKLDESLPESIFGSSAVGKKKLHQRLARQITTMEHGFALLAWQNQQAIACICGHIYDKPESTHSPVGIIYNLWVEPEGRRRGLATQLVKNTEIKLKEVGAKSFQVAWRNDPIAEQFWQSLGYGGYEILGGKLAH